MATQKKKENNFNRVILFVAKGATRKAYLSDSLIKDGLVDILAAKKWKLYPGIFNSIHINSKLKIANLTTKKGPKKINLDGCAYIFVRLGNKDADVKKYLKDFFA